MTVNEIDQKPKQETHPLPCEAETYWIGFEDLAKDVDSGRYEQGDEQHESNWCYQK